ncbi:hypothetical protein B0H34DRAFT_645099 [Crassisporium funariophilum]|nr:hypothetical protein B0H34DRAFT_645099 [Crassisporium funariophilum]
MVQPEKRLLWHPRYDNKFVVGGNSQITLYEWAPEYPEIRHVTSQQDLHFMKCFAWSPDSAFDDLMAVGLSTGKVDLIRLEAGKQAQRKNILSSGPSVSLPVRNSRTCNALAFSSADPNYLAVGLDKVRGDSSLVIWDISTLSSSLTLPVPGSNELSLVNPLTPAQPRPQPQIPRLDSQARIDPRILQQHAPTEVVSSLSFLPSSTHLLLAGISHRWLRLFDLRSPALAALNVASKVQGIATDPYDAHRIACFGDGIISVWDARRLTQPTVMFTERDATADGAKLRPGSVYANIEFSSTRRGCLATLEKDASYVRFWDLSEARASVVEGSVTGGGGNSSDGETKSSRESSRATRRSWAANLPWPSGDRQNQQSPKERDLASSAELSNQPAFVLSDTRRTKYFSRSLSSFALVPNPKSPYPLTSNVMVVNKEGDLELYAIYDAPKQTAWSALGDLAIGSGLGLKVVEGYVDPELDEEFTSDAIPKANSGYKYGGSDRDKASRSRSAPTRDQSLARGRPAQASGHLIAPMPVIPTPSPPPLFGRGDDDGFPALTSIVTPTGLSATRPGKTRTYSPASVRKYRNGERVDVKLSQHRSRSRTDTIPADDHRGASVRDGGRHVSPSRRQKSRELKKRGFLNVVQEDISMVMRQRVLAGYGLSKPQHNIHITQDDHHDPSDGTTQTLSELWAWIYHSQEVLCVPTPRLHGYDFSYQGLLGIWEGFKPMDIHSQHIVDDTPIAVQRSLLLDLPVAGPQVHHSHSSSTGSSGYERHTSRRSHSPADDLHGSWPAALTSLAARRGADRSTWKPTVPTNKLAQRQIALQVCGWSLREEELAAAVKRWEKEGKLSRAACWLVFTRQYSKAVDLLMRSDDETHQMMSGTIAALAPHASGGSNKSVELREHYGRLIIRLHDPYFRVMLTHLVVGDWSDVLEEDVIPFRERLAIAFQFLDDKALSSYLRRTTEQACAHGDIDAIIITGLTPLGMDILQSYLDSTGDVQSTAILSSYVCPQKFKDKRAERWLETYRDLLDGFKLHHHRVGFDIERGQILHEAMQNGDMVPEEWAPRQILFRCHYCNKPVTNPGVLLATHQQKGRPTACSNCNRELPRCSVCLMTLSIVHDAAREVDLGELTSTHSDTFDDAIVICQTCRHGGHAVHILEWFLGEDGRRTHDICPVADCNCRCADEF